jgi:hypothetical protein
LEDRRLSAIVRSRVSLLYAEGADSSTDRPAHVRAASGLVRVNDRIALIQDDASFVALIDAASGQAHAIPLPTGDDGVRQFDHTRGNKKHKLDLEACVATALDGDPTLLAFGSGSKPRREVVDVMRFRQHGRRGSRFTDRHRDANGDSAHAAEDSDSLGVATDYSPIWRPESEPGNGSNRERGTAPADGVGDCQHQPQPQHANRMAQRLVVRYDRPGNRDGLVQYERSRDRPRSGVDLGDVFGAERHEFSALHHCRSERRNAAATDHAVELRFAWSQRD